MSSARETPSYRVLVLVLFALGVTLACAGMGYFSIFTNLQHQDDEGQLILSARNFLSGQPMYGPGGTIYGPYFYLYEWTAHKLMGVPISTESARLVSLTFWIAASILALLLAYRATGSPVIAVGAQFLVFRALAFIPGFPAHPQEFCITALLALGLAAYAGNRVWRMVWLGALTGAMIATKINAGMFAALALVVASAYAARPAWLRRLAFLSFGALAFPVLLMWGHHSERWGQEFVFVVVVSLAAAIVAVARAELVRELELRHLAIGLAALAGAIAAGAAFSVLHGGSVLEMLDWIVFKPRRSFASAWVYPAHVRIETLPWAVAGLGLAWCTTTRRAGGWLVALLKLAFAGGVIFLCFIDAIHYDQTSHLLSWERSGGYNLTIFFAAPFVWLVTVPSGGIGSRDRFGRAWLAVAAVAQLLYAYPIAASPQVRFPAVLMIVAAAICLSDGLGYAALHRPEWNRPMVVRPLAAAAVLIVVWFSFDMARQARQRYEGLEPLDVAGLNRIHVPPDVASAMGRLVRAVSAQGCTRLLTVPSMFSLNLWTGTDPLTFDGGNWVNATSDDRQERLVEVLSRDPRTCVIYSQRLLKEWQFPDDPDRIPPASEDLSSKPVVRFLAQNYNSEFRVIVRPRSDYNMDYEFLAPNR